MTNEATQHRKLKRLARDTGNIEYKTQNNDKRSNTTQKTKKMSNTDSIKKPGMNRVLHRVSSSCFL